MERLFSGVNTVNFEEFRREKFYIMRVKGFGKYGVALEVKSRGNRMKFAKRLTLKYYFDSKSGKFGLIKEILEKLPMGGKERTTAEEFMGITERQYALKDLERLSVKSTIHDVVEERVIRKRSVGVPVSGTISSTRDSLSHLSDEDSPSPQRKRRPKLHYHSDYVEMISQKTGLINRWCAKKCFPSAEALVIFLVLYQYSLSDFEQSGKEIRKASRIADLHLEGKAKNVLCPTGCYLISTGIKSRKYGELNVLCMTSESFDMDLQKYYRKFRKDRPFTEVQLLRIYVQLANAVQTFHGNNLTHNDIKLSNFLVNVNGNDPQIVLADFGTRSEDVTVYDLDDGEDGEEEDSSSSGCEDEDESSSVIDDPNPTELKRFDCIRVLQLFYSHIPHSERTGIVRFGKDHGNLKVVDKDAVFDWYLKLSRKVKNGLTITHILNEVKTRLNLVDPKQ